MLKVQEYLKNKSLNDLENEFHIKTKRHAKYNNLVLLKYNQIETPMNDLTRECRGIILDENNNWNVVNYTYKRFSNYGETWGDIIDWNNSPKVFSKEDGSLIQMYWYDGHWEIATSGTPDASGQVLNTQYTFADLFWKVWNELGYKYPNSVNSCYAFELCTKYNRVVVRHIKEKIVLHGTRRLSDFKEENPVIIAHQNNWECAKIYDLSSWEDIQKSADALEPTEHEGFVVCDDNYNRSKVKSKVYVALAHIKDAFSTRRMLEIVRTQEGSEFLQYYPEYKDIYCDVQSKYSYLVGKIEGFYDAIKNINDRKEFAMIAKNQFFSGILFGLRFGKCDNIKQALADMNIRYLEEWLDLKLLEL